MNGQSFWFVWARWIFFAASVALLIFVPPVGIGVAVLAVATAAMSLHEHQKVRDKTTWIVIILLLLGVEGRSIFKAAREENDRFIAEVSRQSELRKEQDDHFVESLSAITGGDSFAILLFIPLEVPPSIKAYGKYPIHDLKLLLTYMDFRKGMFPMYQYNVGGLGVGQVRQFLDFRPRLPNKDDLSVNVQFDALNGHWAQFTRVRKVNGVWHESRKIVLPIDNGRSVKVLLDQEDPEAPLLLK